ncbi:MAG TPA: hypothetical protein VHP11_17990 [Tepidisphaeraceae bacterium]|nr:hypothetical protein [Tepidisphaeraceae bacterium]
MSTAVTQTDQPPQPAKKGNYFQQSGWVLACTMMGGVFFWAVHFCARKMPPSEYGIVGTLLQVLNQMAIPAMGLQTIFVQEAALSQSEEHRRELAGAVRAVAKATFLLWVAAVVAVFFFQQDIIINYKITNPVALWATVAMGLTSLWLPMLNGIMLGRENFFWYGLNSMLVAFSRLVLVGLIVFVFGGYAAGTMVAVVLAMSVGVGIGIWQTFHLWTGPATPFVWKPWLKRIVPLTFGAGATTFMFTFDMIAVQRFLPDSGIYAAAGMICRAIMFLVAPLVLVMFPKIVQSAAKAERTDVLGKALGATALIAIMAALGATFFAKIPILIVQGRDYIDAAKLVPLFTWCILPLTVSNVLINNLLARQQYKVVPWLVLVAIGYMVTLWTPLGHNSFWNVIYSLGIFAVLYFLVCFWFTWRAKGQPAPAAQAPATAS